MSSSTRRFLITGAAGQTGSVTTRLLLEHGHQVTALVRRVDDRATALAEAGADIVTGDLRDFRDVSRAMVGADAVYFCYPVEAGLIESTVNVGQAAAEAGVQAVVNMSQVSARRDAKSNAAQQHWIAERLLDRGPFGTTHLRPTFFAEWITWGWLGSGDSGVIALPFGTGRHAPITGADQARVIAAVLERPESHDRQVYPLYGPVEMNHDEIAAAVSRVLDIEVRYEPLSIEAFQTGLLERGVSQHLVQHLGNVATDYRNGVFAGTNNLVETISGKAPMTVEEYVAANRPAFEVTTGQFAVSAASV